jgi:hypothetical protein
MMLSSGEDQRIEPFPAIYLAFACTNTRHLHLHQFPHSLLINSRAGLFGNRPRPTEWLSLARLLIQNRPRPTRHTPAGIPAKPINRCRYPLLILRCQANAQMELHDRVSLCHGPYFGPSAICDYLSPIACTSAWRSCFVTSAQKSHRGLV